MPKSKSRPLGVSQALGAQSAVRSGASTSARAGGASAATRTFIEPKTGTRKGTVSGQSQSGLPPGSPGTFSFGHVHQPPFP